MPRFYKEASLDLPPVPQRDFFSGEFIREDISPSLSSQRGIAWILYYPALFILFMTEKVVVVVFLSVFCLSGFYFSAYFSCFYFLVVSFMKFFAAETSSISEPFLDP